MLNELKSDWMRLLVVCFVVSAGCARTEIPLDTRADVPSRSSTTQTKPAADREDFLRLFAQTYRFTAGQPKSISLTPDGSAVLFLRSGPRSVVQDLYEFDMATGTERVLLTAERVLAGGEEKLTAEELARRERMRLSSRGIVSYSLSDDGRSILVPLSGRLFVVDRTGGGVKELKSSGGYPIDPSFSPDGTMVACVRDGDVYVIDVASGSETRLTESPGGGTITNGLAEFVAQEEMDRFRGYWFSPDGAYIAYQQTDTEGLERFHIADPVNPDKEPQVWPYPRAGKKNAVVRLGVVPVTGGKTVWVDWNNGAFPYLATVVWKEKTAPLTIRIQNREQTEQRTLAVDHATGAARELLVERCETWLNLDQQTPRWMKGGDSFLLMNEVRVGEWQLEVRSKDGSFIRSLTPDSGFGLRSLAHVDEENGVAYVIASAEPTQRHVWAVPIPGLGPAKGERKSIALTNEPGHHSAIFSRKSPAMIRVSNTLGGKVSWTAVRSDGSIAGELASIAQSPPFTPNLELVSLGGALDYRAVVIRPRRFDSSRKYPVIVSVYGGPHAQTVNATARGYMLQQWFADQGFVVVSIDGRGTPGRGLAWERSIKGDFMKAPLEDQVAALQQLGARFKELDLSRVGIYGWSFGGYFSAHAVMRRPDIYKAGCAGAPVCDFADYDTHYTERYLGLPEKNAAGYASSNVLTYCKDLTRPLLIIHGTADDNVYFMHSLKMTEALFRAGKHFEFLPLAGFTHMVPDPEVTTRLYSRVADFFLRELGAD